MRQTSSDLCEGPILEKIILYTIPIILTGILQLLFNAADLVVVGRYCGSVSVGAVGATNAIINLLVNLFIGLSVGAGVSVAHGIGAGQAQKVHRTIHTAIPTAFISGIVLTMIGVFGARSFLQFMGTPDDVIGLSTIYMQTYFCGISASMLYNFGAAILRAAGDTRGPLLFLTAAGVINVMLNLFFVIVLHMDVAGVGLATAISQIISAVLVLLSLMSRDDACKLELKEMRIYPQELWQIVRIGLPAGIQGSLFSISNVLIQSSINSFGSIAVSGNAAASNIEGFVFTTMNAFHQTGVNFTGQNYGAGKFDRIRSVQKISLLCVLCTGAVFGTLVFLFGRPLLRIYIPDSPEAIEYGMLRIAWICLPYFICGLMDVMTGMIRGLNYSLVPMVISVLGVCGFRVFWIFVIFQIPQYHTLSSLYMSYTISWSMTFLVQLLAFHFICRKREREFAVSQGAQVLS